MNIRVDDDLEIGYEKNTKLVSIARLPVVVILNNIPARSRNLIKKTHQSAKKVIETATTHEAIEVLYKFGEPKRSSTFLQRFFHYIWFTTHNSKAVRNRLRLVERELKKAIKEQDSMGRDLNILSIASGSARAIVDSVFNNESLEGKNVFINFLDKNPKANEYSKNLVHSMSFPDNYKFNWITDTISNFPKYLDNRRPNIVEVVGLLDYFDNEAVRRIMKLIYDNLEDGGVFITSNIVDNLERKFITNVVGWEMIYKHPKDFFDIAKDVGFNPENIEILYEPFRIHFVMIAKK